MPRKPTKTKSNIKTDDELDSILLQHLVSPFSFATVTHLQKEGLVEVSSPQHKKKIANRLLRLRKFQESDPEEFALLCALHKLDIADDRNTTFGVDKRNNVEATYAFANQSPIVKERPTPRMTASSSQDELGNKIVLYLDDGLICCIYWIDSKLDDAILKIEIAEDGSGAIMKKKTPKPKDAKTILSMYSWSNNRDNFVVKALDSKLRSLKKEVTPSNEWKPTQIVKTNEEIIRSFVDIEGNITNDVQFKTVEGRRVCVFFMKTLRSHESVPPKAAKFVNHDGVHAGIRVDRSTKMSDEDDDDEYSEYSVAASQLDNVKSEMEEKMGQLATNLQAENQQLKQQIGQLDSNMNNVNGNLGHIMSFLQKMQNGEQQQAPVPDNHSSIHQEY